jgi:hypothetical protein
MCRKQYSVRLSFGYLITYVNNIQHFEKQNIHLPEPGDLDDKGDV